MLTYFLISGPCSWIAPAEKADSIAPAWSVDLKNTLRAKPTGVVGGGQGHEYTYLPEVSLWFLDANTIVASFVTLDSGASAELNHRNGDAAGSRLRLQLIFLDASSGRITNSFERPAQARDARIVTVHDGTFVTLTANTLTRLASDGQQLATLTLPTHSENWLTHHSQTGGSIVLTPLFVNKKGSSFWVDADTLRIFSSWDDTLTSSVSQSAISDNQLLRSTCWLGYTVTATPLPRTAGPCKSEIQVRGLHSDWRSIATSQAHVNPQFVTADLIFVPGDPATLIRADGELVLTEPQGKRSWGCFSDSAAYPASDGSRLVIPSCLQKGAMPSLDIGGRSVLKQMSIFDLAHFSHSRILNINGVKFDDYMQFAIAPDGSKFAVLHGTTIALFDLPPATN